jgi:hypothetical protein
MRFWNETGISRMEVPWIQISSNFSILSTISGKFWRLSQ